MHVCERVCVSVGVCVYMHMYMYVPLCLHTSGDANSQFWNELASIFEDFLFNDM